MTSRADYVTPLRTAPVRPLQRPCLPSGETVSAPWATFGVVDVQLEPVVTEDAESVYLVKVGGTIVGRVERHKQLARNGAGSFVIGGYDSGGRTQRAELWLGIVDYAGLDEREARRVQRQVQLSKTTRLAAARQLVDAFESAGVSIPH